MNLTFGRDKLVAISGFAQLIQEENQDLYLAGLWWNDIELQLLRSQRLPGGGFQGGEYRAPSWSWASVDEGEGGVDYLSRSDTHEYVYYSYAIDAQVVPVGDGPFWELCGRRTEDELLGYPSWETQDGRTEWQDDRHERSRD
jgi:hypothetical protein